DDRATAVLQRRRDDLRRARRTAADEYDERDARVAGTDRIQDLGCVPALLVRHHRAAAHERRRRLDRLVEQAAGIVAQVEHDAAHVPRLGRPYLRSRPPTDTTRERRDAQPLDPAAERS